MPMQRRLPKFGFRSQLKRITEEVRVGELERIEGGVVDLDALRLVGLIRGNMKRAKVFGDGQLTRAMTVKGLAVTKGARRAIEAAGGKVEI
jgi:large subunit ribosomal protein L15